jgi:ribosomal protein S18 acetylase RimI-like enzyme
VVKDIHLLTFGDLDGALTLSSTAGWNQQLADWRMLLKIAPAGSFAAVADGRIVGTSIGIDYGGFGWIAMMLVDPAYRSRGFGRRLLEAAMDAIPADRPIRLDATPMGRPLYERHGFRDEAQLARYVAVSAGRPHFTATADPMTAADLVNVAECDREIFRGDRGAVFDWTRDTAPQYAWVARGPAQPQYCFGRRGRLFDQVGPVVAEEDETAQTLVATAMSSAGDRAVVVDAFDQPGGFTEWLRASGFQVERPLFRMCRPVAGRSVQARPIEGLREFAIFGPEFG